jgi:choline dehydrogenase
VNGRRLAIAQTTIYRGLRQSASRAFLRPALRRSKIKLFSHVLATSIILENGVARGVSIQRNGRNEQICARREVIVAAGAIGSPHLLLLSGIGPAKDLESHGVKLEVALPGVGKNMQEHLGFWVVHGVRDGVRTANLDYNFAGKLKHAWKYLLRREGQLANPTSQALGFLKTEPGLDAPDIQLHFAPMGYVFEGDKVTVMDSPAMMGVANVCRPLSRGEVGLASAEPTIPPRINAALLSDPVDVEKLIAGCRLVRRLFASEAMSQYAAEEQFPGPDVQTDEEWASVIRNRSNPIYHIAGTCKMGSDRMAVVDDRLRVRGVQRLRVADSSIMPTITSGNTNAPTMMIAARAADMILADQNHE